MWVRAVVAAVVVVAGGTAVDDGASTVGHGGVGYWVAVGRVGLIGRGDDDGAGWAVERTVDGGWGDWRWDVDLAGGDEEGGGGGEGAPEDGE